MEELPDRFRERPFEAEIVESTRTCKSLLIEDVGRFALPALGTVQHLVIDFAVNMFLRKTQTSLFKMARAPGTVFIAGGLLQPELKLVTV